MKRSIGLAAILATLFLSSNTFAQNATFEFNGQKYAVAVRDLSGPYYTWEHAQNACKVLGSDWTLPSKEELISMCGQLYSEQMNTAGFAVDAYWSSTDGGETNGWGLFFQDTGNCYYANYYKPAFKLRVRCIRAL